MGIPPKDIVSNGRANPLGINYLYTADNVETVLSEIRAYNGSIVSIAEIEMKEDLRLVDLTDIYKIDSPFSLEFYSLSKDIEAIEILLAFNRELSKPINSKDSLIDYIPTQYIVELIKMHQYDGIKFSSSVGEGNNVVLFDSSKIKIKDVQLYEVKKITYVYNKW